MNRLAVLENLEAEWRDCDRCPLHRTRRKVVHWRGNPDAPIALIGEAPGEEEDIQGRPFVGPAGRELDTILQWADLDPEEDVFITNIVACRPPGNRDPTGMEASQCRPRLDITLDIIKPRVIVLMGKVAASRVAGIRGDVRTWRGQPLEVEMWSPSAEDVVKVTVIPTVHPSYVLRTGLTARSCAQADMRAAKEIACKSASNRRR